jgi:signal transduction histidine kinase
MAIIRYRLLEVDQLIGAGAAYTIMAMGLIVIYSGILAIFNRWIWKQHAFTEELTLGFTVLVVVIFNPLRDRIRHAIDRVFFRDQLDFKALIGSLSRKIARSIEMKDLIETTVHTLPGAFRITTASLVVIEEERLVFYPPGSTRAGLIGPESELIAVLNKNRDYLLCQEEDGRSTLRTELAALRNAGIAVVLGLKSGETLSGILMLGKKKSGRAYSSTEIQILTTLSHHMAVAMENALRYEALQESKTRLQNLFNKVVQAERLAAIGEMTAVLAHEIKNPLGVIRSSAELLTQSEQPPEVQEELLQYIVEEIDSVTLVVNNVLGLARYKPPELRPLDPVWHVRALLERWRMSADHNPDVSIEVEGGYSGTNIFADGNQIGQVVLNLVRNAEEAMPEGGMLRVKILDDDKGGAVMMTFEDSGSGIPDELLKDVFKKFFSSKKSGIGLGLAVCEQIVASHQGTISLENNAGPGVTVMIRLPFHPFGVVATNSDPSKSQGSNPAGETHQ